MFYIKTFHVTDYALYAVGLFAFCFPRTSRYEEQVSGKDTCFLLLLATAAKRLAAPAVVIMPAVVVIPATAMIIVPVPVMILVITVMIVVVTLSTYGLLQFLFGEVVDPWLLCKRGCTCDGGECMRFHKFVPFSIHKMSC